MAASGPACATVRNTLLQKLLNDHGILQLLLNEYLPAVYYELTNVNAFEVAQQIASLMGSDTDKIMAAPDDSFITSFRAHRALEAFTRQLKNLHLAPTAAEGRTYPPPQYTAPSSPSAPRKRVRASPRLTQAIKKCLNRRTSALGEMLREMNKFETTAAILTEGLRSTQKKWDLPPVESLTTIAHRLENSIKLMKHTLTELRTRVAADLTQQPNGAIQFALMEQLKKDQKELQRDMFEYFLAMEQEMTRMVSLGDGIRTDVEGIAARYLAHMTHV
ncbi:hypothetical protein KI688_007220 [Linnemannia hyalina]|uniref:RdRp catalytic domain-containing protein n=1 Tax=Linnemannia hyalina TaxID=64524 RepID=A0A9P7XJE8_9FUNG|nr:hypothetical protein KI688_007220 [Linnemannia hyalina]